MTAPALDVAFHGRPEDLPARAAAAERRGVEGLFVAEAAHDPFVALALAAGSTERIRLGTSIAVAFARTPMAMAYPAWDVHRISGGRLVLGLGSQIRPHIERRFSMEWSAPAERMTEYVRALRAIWTSWQTGEPLAFEGRHYTHTLMPPLFSPGPVEAGLPPVWLAAVGPRMVRAAGEVADGLICHPLTSRSYLAEVVLPEVERARSGAARDGAFTLSALAMTATGGTEEALAEAVAGVRRQIGFYASTPAYLPVLEHHGWPDLHTEARRLTREGRWEELGSLVDDEVLGTFAVVGEPAAAASGFRARFAGLADRVMPSLPYAGGEEVAVDLASAATD